MCKSFRSGRNYKADGPEDQIVDSQRRELDNGCGSYWHSALRYHAVWGFRWKKQPADMKK